MANTRQVPEDFSDGVSQRSPKEISSVQLSTLKSPCSTPRGRMQRIPNMHLIISNDEGEIDPNQRIELNGQGGLRRTDNLIFSVVIFIDRQIL